MLAKNIGKDTENDKLYVNDKRKRSLTCYKVDTRMDHIQSSSLYSRWRLVVDRDACAAFWKQT